MADRAQWVAVAVLLLAAAALALFVAPSGGRSALDPRPSTFRATPNGTLGLYLLLEELGIPVERRTTPLADGEPLPATLAILAPTEPLSAAEVDALLEWVDRGGRLLYAAAPGDTLLSTLGLVVEPVYGDSVEQRGAATAAPAGDHGFTTGVERVYAFRFAFADSSAALSTGAVPLLRISEDRLGAVLLRQGSGSVLAWSDAGPLANHSLQSGGAALVFARAARDFASDGAAIEFDEFHHGFRGGGSPAGALVAFLRDTRAGRASLQLALAGLGLVVLLGSRFGAPHPPPPARRRSPLEHLDALASAYHAGNARNRARHLIVAGAARRLGRKPPAPGEELEFLTRLGTHPSARREAADVLIEEWGKGERADLTTLAHQADRLVMETRAS